MARTDLGQPSTASAAVKGSLPRRLTREDDRVNFQNFALPVPQVSPGAVPGYSRSTTSGSSSRGAEDVNWDEMLTASRPDTLCGSQRSQVSHSAAASPAARHRWEPQLGSPILPRPVLSSNRPLRRPSSTSSMGRLDDLLAAAESVKEEVRPQKRNHRRSSVEAEADLKQLVEMFPQFTDTRLRPLSEIFERTNPKLRHVPTGRAEEKLAAETVTAQLEAKLQEAVTSWGSAGRQQKSAGAMSPISEKTERTEKATPPSAKAVREASSPALLSWEAAETRPVISLMKEADTIEGPPLEVKELELPEEMLAPPEASPQRARPEVTLCMDEIRRSKPSQEMKRQRSPLAQLQAEKCPEPLPPEPPSPTLKGLLQSMEQDEHFAWLARLGPVRPLTLDETLQEMAMTIASVDAQLLSAHPPSQLEAHAQLQQASVRAAEANPSPPASSPAAPSPELHQEEEPREPRAPAATPKSAEIAGELLRKKVKAPILSDTPDTASVISRGSKKEIEEAFSQGVGTPESSTLARFLNSRRSPAPSTAGGTPRPNSGQRQAQGSRSRVSSEDSNAFSDVSFFGQSSICEPHGTVASGRKGRPAPPTAAAATPKSLVECALCGRRRSCQPGSCFCIECSQRMNQIDPASPSSDDSASGRPSAGRAGKKVGACVICSKPLPADSSGSVLCPSCLKGQR